MLRKAENTILSDKTNSVTNPLHQRLERNGTLAYYSNFKRSTGQEKPKIQ